MFNLIKISIFGAVFFSSKLGMEVVNGEVLCSFNSTLTKITEGGIGHLHKSEILHLGGCKIEEIHVGAFKGGSGITELYLHNNLLKDLDLNVFSDLPNLEILSLGGNPLRNFGANGQFPKMGNLKELSLEECELTYIEPNLFENLNNLEKLELQNNQFTTLDLNTVRSLESLNAIGLNGNPWQCGNHMTSLVNLFKVKHVMLIDGNNDGAFPGCNITEPEKLYDDDDEEDEWEFPEDLTRTTTAAVLSAVALSAVALLLISLITVMIATRIRSRGQGAIFINFNKDLPKIPTHVVQIN